MFCIWGKRERRENKGEKGGKGVSCCLVVMGERLRESKSVETPTLGCEFYATFFYIATCLRALDVVVFGGMKCALLISVVWGGCHRPIVRFMRFVKR